MPIWHQSPKLTPRYFLETPRLFGYPFPLPFVLIMTIVLSLIRFNFLIWWTRIFLFQINATYNCILSFKPFIQFIFCIFYWLINYRLFFHSKDVLIIFHLFFDKLLFCKWVVIIRLFTMFRAYCIPISHFFWR